MDIICPFRAKYAQPVEKSAFIQILCGTRHDAVEGLKIMQCIGGFERMICVFYKKKRQSEPSAFVFTTSVRAQGSAVPWKTRPSRLKYANEFSTGV